MPRSDDPSGFPAGRRHRLHPRESERGTSGTDGDWRYPDPSERYGQDYDDFDPAPPSADAYTDEWDSDPGDDDFASSFDGPQRWAMPSWDDETPNDDPFAWAGPDNTSQGWPDGDPRSAYANGEHGQAAPDPFRSPHTPDVEPERGPVRDDSLFRRIDGSLQDSDLAGLSGADDPFSSDFREGDAPENPAELGNRFFAQTNGAHDQVGEPDTAPPANVFDFDAHRAGTRAPQLDDPYSWDADQLDPLADVDAQEGDYPAHYDQYDPYAADPELLPEDELDADFLDDDAEEYDEPAPQPRSRRKLMVAGVLVAAVATGGGAAFVYKSYQEGSLSGLEAPTLLADSGPVKEKPDDPGGKDFPDGNKRIYDRLSGDSAKPGDDKSASSDSSDGASTSIPGIVTTGTEATPDTLDARIAAALRKSGKAPDETASADPDSPRSVRTVTVRPDGSMVSAAPETTGATDAASDDKSSVTTTAGIVSTIGGDEDTSSDSESSAADDKSTTDSVDASTVAPRPERAAPRPEETKVASADTSTTSADEPATASANPYFVQVAARRDQTSALAAFADLQQKYPGILGGLAPTIKKADLGEKGVWYRLWVGPMTARSDARDVCGRLKSAGLGGCFVRSE